jgi:hypothetical protein
MRTDSTACILGEALNSKNIYTTLHAVASYVFLPFSRAVAAVIV